MTEQDMKNLEAMFQRHVGTFYEDFQSKLDLVVEGHAALDKKIDQRFDQLTERVDHNSFQIQVLNQKIDGVAADLKATDERLSKKIDGVEVKLTTKIDGVEEKLTKKIDGVAADLKAHRADTEAHHGVYRVKES